MADLELVPDYYWRNLRTVVDTVLDAHPGLFTPEQHAVFEGWRVVPRPAQLLYARLLLRRGPDFRRSTLAYTEVGDVEAALAELAEARLVTLEPPLLVVDRIELFTVAELRVVGQRLGMNLRGRRAAVIEALLQAPAEAIEESLRILDPLVRRHGCSAFSRAQVVFFGNRQQDMSTFVRVALDQLRYAEYAVDRSHPLFADRAALDAYLAAGSRWDAAFAARMADDDAALVALGAEAAEDLVRRAPVAPFRARVDPARADSRVVSRAARAHERLGDHDAAAAGYRLLLQTRRHPPTAARAADRLGLLCQRAGDVGTLATDVEGLLAEPNLDEPSLRLVQRRLRLARVGPDPRHAEPVVPEQTLLIPPATAAEAEARSGSKALYRGILGDAVTVEEAVLERLGGDGVWCGGRSTTLFGLFRRRSSRPCRGLPAPFQDAPVDRDTPLFYLRRQRQQR
ncbi:MAG: hypothetical protein R3F43_13700 [bacterium]